MYIHVDTCTHTQGVYHYNGQCAYLDDLPEEAQNEVRSALHDVLGANVDDVAADGRGRVESKRLVLVDGEGVQLALVDGSLVHCA